MREIEYKADLLAPLHEKILEFSCIHPSRILEVLPEFIKEDFRVTSTKFWEDEIKWDVTKEPIEFFGSWRGRDPKDERTDIWVFATAQGEQTLKTKEGWVIIKLRGIITSKFPYSWRWGIHWAYMRLYYSKQRRWYMKEGRERLDMLEDRIRKYFEVLRK
ncbi:MAG: hypothetical protein ACE5J4_01160 [Candidatus Aenigmatarchaeota archaeon]